MDQKKIGQFIAACRKEQGLTQVQLADQLGITNQAISKWETAKSMPDVSMMIPLCEILNISVNELLSGEKLTMETYREKAEENLIEMQEKKEKAEKALTKFNLVLLAAVIIGFLTHMLLNYFDIETGGFEGLVVIAICLGTYAVYFRKYYEIKLK